MVAHSPNNPSAINTNAFPMRDPCISPFGIGHKNPPSPDVQERGDYGVRRHGNQTTQPAPGVETPGYADEASPRLNTGGYRFCNLLDRSLEDRLNHINL